MIGEKAALNVTLPDWAQSLPDDACITTAELAAASGCCISSVYSAVENNFLPQPVKFHRHGRRDAWRFRVTPCRRRWWGMTASQSMQNVRGVSDVLRR